MTRGSAFRWNKAFVSKLLVVALPIVVQNLLTSSVHMVDNIMIGRLGDTAYAAVQQANRYTFVFQLFLFGVTSGCSIYYSQLWGKRDVPAMQQVMGISLMITVGISGLFALAATLFPRVVVSFFLVEGESFELAVKYIRIIAPGYLIVSMDLAYATCMKSAQQTRIPMAAGLTGTLTNVVLNYVMIFGHFGFPAMGVEGAAYATVLASTASLTINVIASYSLRLPSAFSLRKWKKPDGAFLRQFFRTISPVIFNEGLWGTGITMYGVFIGRLGDAAITAMGIYNTVENLLSTAMYGVMSACAILVGEELGKGDRDGAYLTAKRMLVLVVGLGWLIGAALLVLRWPLVSMFSISAEAAADAVTILSLAVLFTWIQGYNAVNVVGILRAGGDTVYSMFLDVSALWLVGVPLTGLAALVWHWPLWAVFLMTRVDEVMKLFIGTPRFLGKKWMRDMTVLRDGTEGK